MGVFALLVVVPGSLPLIRQQEFRYRKSASMEFNLL